MVLLLLSLILSTPDFQHATHATDNISNTIDVDGVKSRVSREVINSAWEVAK